MSEEVRKAWYKKWWGIGLIVLGVLILIGVVNSPDKDTKRASTGEPAKSEPAAKEEPPAAKEAPLKKVGEEIQVGEVKWLVVKAPEKVKEIGNEFTKETAGGIFLVLELKAELTGKESGTINASQLKVIDGQGRKFESSNEGQTALLMTGKESLFLKQVNPNVPVSGFATFDIPEAATGLKLQIEDLPLFSSKKGLVDLGL